MKIGIVVICCFVSAGLSAQTRGRVTIEKDPLIDSLIAKRIQLSVAPSGAVSAGTVVTRPGVIVAQMGYRVQVFYGSDRREVFSQQAKFNGLYPSQNTYITYKQPNYYLRVGDFRTRLDAQRFLNELRPTFPTLFIFREKINAPSLDYIHDR
ncbi:MAG: SPOR domain-containing protein [Chitinophagaceae bacterium]|nr:MAG: SPOR domain-containing protein [Chitinophagaceae bacterium]